MTSDFDLDADALKRLILSNSLTGKHGGPGCNAARRILKDMRQ